MKVDVFLIKNNTKILANTSNKLCSNWSNRSISIQDSSLVDQAPKNIIKTIEEYHKILETNPNHKLVRLSEFIPDAKIYLRYAQYDNLFKKPIYNTDIAFLNIKAARALKDVQAELIKDGYRLVIWDAYRPYSITVQMWNIIKDARYAATPARGSRHNRGMAVDISFEKLNGDSVLMPTKFDECTKNASPLFQGIPLEARKNRDYLIRKMSKHGFTVLNSEWWHFDYRGYWDEPIMDISFEELIRNIE